MRDAMLAVIRSGDYRNVFLMYPQHGVRTPLQGKDSEPSVHCMIDRKKQMPCDVGIDLCCSVSSVRCEIGQIWLHFEKYARNAFLVVVVY